MRRTRSSPAQTYVSRHRRSRLQNSTDPRTRSGSQRDRGPTTQATPVRADLSVCTWQVSRLLTKLEMCNNKQDMHTLFELMDHDHSGSVSEQEFLSAIDKALGDTSASLDLDEAKVSRKTGYAGTTWRKQGNIVYCTLSAVSIIAVCAVLHLLEKYEGMLAPLGMAYFFCLLLQPLIDILEQRPLTIFGYLVCHHNRGLHISKDDERICCKWRSDTCGLPSDRQLDISATACPSAFYYISGRELQPP